jgi:alanine dehydrogenase
MDAFLTDVLRLHPEPSEHVSDAAVHQTLVRSPRLFLDYLHSELAAIAAGCTHAQLPAKQVFTDPANSGDFRLMPCILRGAAGVRKTVKLVGTNATQRCIEDQITVGRAFVLHPTDNFITHSFEACALSSARTGACAAVSARILASSRASIAVIGAGRVGYYAALYLASLGGVERIHLYDVEPGRAARVADALEQTCGQWGVHVIEGCPRASVDFAVLATTGSEPVYGPRDFFARTIISLGADTAWQRELDPALAKTCDIYVDNFDALACGDLLDWIGRGLVERGDIRDLIDLLGKAPPRGRHDRTLFISTGSALFDNLTIGYLLERMGSDTFHDSSSLMVQTKSSYLPLRPRNVPASRRTKISSKG